jgi:outer membrane biosynthesis protein TonB
MTKRLTLVGLAAVAVVWGPYVYSELARQPLSAAAPDSHVIENNAPVQVTPVVFAPTARVEPAQPQPEPAATAIEPASDPPPADPEPAAQPVEAAEPAIAAQPVRPPVEAPQPETPVAQPAAPQPLAAEENAHKNEPAATAEPTENAAKAEAPSAAPEPTDPAAAAAQAQALAPAFRSTFDREARDTQWAEKEEPRLTQLLASSGLPASAISEVRCQSTVCRVSFSATDLENASPAQLAQLMQRAREEFGPSLALDPAKREGDQAAAFYLLRKGYELGHGRESM